MSENAKKEIKKPEAEILVDRQLEIADGTKRADLTGLILFAAFILIFAVAFWVVPDNKTSELERRQLKQCPDFTFSRLWQDVKKDTSELFMTYEEKLASTESNPSLADEIADYYSDQFPLRNELRTLKAASEILLGKCENNDVMFGNGGYLIKKDTLTQIVSVDGQTADSKDAIETITKNVNYLNALNKTVLSDKNIQLITAIAGRSVDVMESKLPSYYPYDETVELYWDAFEKATSEKNINTVDLREALIKHVDNDEYVYYKTDHHWTSDGAYYAYVELANALGITPHDISEYDIQTVSEDFYGTVYAKAGASLAGADEIKLYRYSGDEQFTVSIPNGEDVCEYKGFYSFNYLETADQYGMFIGHSDTSVGGNNAVTYVTKDTDEERETLILIKDSFAHSVVPFLAQHYDLVILDLRYTGNETVSNVIATRNVKAVIVLENMETFMNDSSALQKAF